MIKKTLPHFSLAQICQSGQCFRMYPLTPDIRPSFIPDPSAHNRYCVFAGHRYLELEQQGMDCSFYCEEQEFEDFWKEYFHLKQDYEAYIRQICPEDSYLVQAAAYGSGIRILHQDLWEMIVSFLISQQNHIGRIRRCIENICQRYGEEIHSVPGISRRAFPRPETLACLKENDLMECNLGYRSKYVIRTARSIADGTVDLGRIRYLPYKEARQELLKLYGVGEKVADCICLFGLHHFQAFPIDTHIRQALQNHYPEGFPTGYEKIRGVLQQYIFYYELSGKSR